MLAICLIRWPYWDEAGVCFRFDKIEINRQMDRISVTGVNTIFSKLLSDARLPTVFNRNSANIPHCNPLMTFGDKLAFKKPTLTSMTARKNPFNSMEIDSKIISWSGLFSRLPHTISGGMTDVMTNRWKTIVNEKIVINMISTNRCISV